MPSITDSLTLEISFPSKCISPPVNLPLSAKSLIIDIMVTLLPHPDSPTIPKASPLSK